MELIIVNIVTFNDVFTITYQKQTVLYHTTKNYMLYHLDSNYRLL